MKKKVTTLNEAERSKAPRTANGGKTQKLVFPFIEITVPADVPPASDPHAVHDYFTAHPEVAEKIVREYDAAYHKWLKSQNKKNAKAKTRSGQAGA